MQERNSELLTQVDSTSCMHAERAHSGDREYRDEADVSFGDHWRQTATGTVNEGKRDLEGPGEERQNGIAIGGAIFVRSSHALFAPWTPWSGRMLFEDPGE